MPITSSAKKALRVAKKKKVFNVRRENAMDRAIKSLKRLVKENKVKEAEKMLQRAAEAAIQTVTKAGGTGSFQRGK